MLMGAESSSTWLQHYKAPNTALFSDRCHLARTFPQVSGITIHMTETSLNSTEHKNLFYTAPPLAVIIKQLFQSTPWSTLT